MEKIHSFLRGFLPSLQNHQESIPRPYFNFFTNVFNQVTYFRRQTLSEIQKDPLIHEFSEKLENKIMAEINDELHKIVLELKNPRFTVNPDESIKNHNQRKTKFLQESTTLIIYKTVNKYLAGKGDKPTVTFTKIDPISTTTLVKVSQGKQDIMTITLLDFIQSTHSIHCESVKLFSPENSNAPG